LVLGPEVSRLARNNVDWYRLLDLCGVTDTVIGDTDGLYHPGSFNDRLLLDLKGTMSEAELHVLRARLEGGIRDKAARGELRKALPVGLQWGEQEGEILLDPDEGGARRDPDDLRSVRGAGVGASGVAVDAPRRSAVPDASLRARRDPVGRPDLSPGAQRA
jgi:DNA invertase Pin-like site-specific DNA recombinase